MKTDCDLAIVGSGFGGSILAMIARRLGMRVCLLERGRHPRFAIGESASPLAGILVEQLADRYDLHRLRPLSAFGTWQRVYPEVVCGLKRGFTYFRHDEGKPFRRDRERTRELLVAASPSNELSDTHWLRSDVDHFLVREAIALGVEYQDGVQLDAMDRAGDSMVLSGHRGGQPVRLASSFIVDASGPRGFVSRALNIVDRGFDGYPPTQALFSHFTDVERCDRMSDYGGDGDSTAEGDAPPYPMDDAALHHVFEGGWMWVLRFGNGVTSAGVAVTDALAAELHLAEGAPAWHRLLARFPSVRAQFAGARPIREFTWMPRLTYRAAAAAGRGWAMLPSAAAFVDPLFSTGIPLTLLGIERLALALERGVPDGHAVAGYNEVTLAEADHTAAFIAGCYAAFARFEAFTAYSMFYFAAASFSELARRVDAPQRPRRFLCADDHEFSAATLQLSPSRAPTDDLPAYAAEVAAAVDRLNVAGLCQPSRRNWYPIEFEDAIRGAAKLGVPPERIRETLQPAFQ
ncbi:MAG: NAD(P)/FAD-dependent oxidoreductase [Vicinamibacterales bacterium]